jgi:hypothetical protein
MILLVMLRVTLGAPVRTSVARAPGSTQGCPTTTESNIPETALAPDPAVNSWPVPKICMGGGGVRGEHKR